MDQSDFATWTIYRSESSFENTASLTPIQVITNYGTTQFVDTTVQLDVNYHYAVSAQDSIGNENLEPEPQGPIKISSLGIQIGQPFGDIVLIAGDVVSITWTDESLTATALVSLYYDNDNQGVDGVVIAQGIDATPDNSGSYQWDTIGMPVGNYYVYGIINENTETEHNYAEGVITIVETYRY